MKYTACAAPSKYDAQEDARGGISLVALRSGPEEARASDSLVESVADRLRRELAGAIDSTLLSDLQDGELIWLHNQVKRRKLAKKPISDIVQELRSRVDARHGRAEQKALPQGKRRNHPVYSKWDEPYTKTPRTQKRGDYWTWKKVRLLAAMLEVPGSFTVDLADLAGMTKKRARIALEGLERGGYATSRVLNSRKLWIITESGIVVLERYRRRKLAGTFPAKDGSLAVGEGKDRTKLSLLLEAAQTVSRELRLEGWYPDTIDLALRIHHVSFILKYVKNDELRARARNFGGLLYSILIRSERNAKARILGYLEHVAGLATDVKNAVVEIASSYRMTFGEACRLVCSLAKIARRETRNQVTVGDVQGVAGWIMQQVRRPLRI